MQLFILDILTMLLLSHANLSHYLVPPAVVGEMDETVLVGERPAAAGEEDDHQAAGPAQTHQGWHRTAGQSL